MLLPTMLLGMTAMAMKLYPMGVEHTCAVAAPLETLSLRRILKLPAVAPIAVVEMIS